MPYCKICDSNNCVIHRFPLGKIKRLGEIHGSSPPEVFIGSYGYPNVYSGILIPETYGDTSILSSPEIWHQKKLTIPQILSHRQKLIYGRAKTGIKQLNTKINSTMQNIALTHKSVGTEFKLKHPITKITENNLKVPLISKASEVSSIRLEENAPVKPRIDYIVNDLELKAVSSINELNNAGINISSIIKILSAGLLGRKNNKKLIPTKWAITAVDDTLSKSLLKEIRFFPQIEEILVFNSEYLGNHYEFLFLPDVYSFEVIEISLKNKGFWQDFETFNPRKNYATDVTGAYYANRFAVVEYLKKIKKQALCLVFRQISKEYNAPLGVGILRQTSREAFFKAPEKFDSINLALDKIQERISIPIKDYLCKSILLKNFNKQKKLTSFF